MSSQQPPENHEGSSWLRRKSITVSGTPQEEDFMQVEDTLASLTRLRNSRRTHLALRHRQQGTSGSENVVSHYVLPAVLVTACVIRMLSRHRSRSAQRAIQKSTTVPESRTVQTGEASPPKTAPRVRAPPLSDSAEDAVVRRTISSGLNTYMHVFVVVFLAIIAALGLLRQSAEQFGSFSALGFEEKSVENVVPTESPHAPIEKSRQTALIVLHPEEVQDGVEATLTQKRSSKDVYAREKSEDAVGLYHEEERVPVVLRNVSTDDLLVFACAFASVLFLALFTRALRAEPTSTATHRRMIAAANHPGRRQEEERHSVSSAPLPLEKVPRRTLVSVGDLYKETGTIQSLKKRTDEKGDEQSSDSSEVRGSTPTLEGTWLPRFRPFREVGAQEAEKTLQALKSRGTEFGEPAKQKPVTVVQKPDTDAKPHGHDSVDGERWSGQHEFGISSKSQMDFRTVKADSSVGQGDGKGSENFGSTKGSKGLARPEKLFDIGISGSNEAAYSAVSEKDAIAGAGVSEKCQFLSIAEAKSLAEALLSISRNAVLSGASRAAIQKDVKAAADLLLSRYSNHYLKYSISYVGETREAYITYYTPWWERLESTTRYRSLRLEETVEGGELRVLFVY